MWTTVHLCETSGIGKLPAGKPHGRHGYASRVFSRHQGDAESPHHLFNQMLSITFEGSRDEVQRHRQHGGVRRPSRAGLERASSGVLPVMAAPIRAWR